MKKLSIACVLFSVVACGDALTRSSNTDTEKTRSDVDAGPPTQPTAHPPTAQGLKAQITAILAAVSSKNRRALGAHVAGLRLPKSKQWFRKHFRAKQAKVMSAEYAPIGANSARLSALFRDLAGRGLTTVQVDRFVQADDLGAVGYQSLALKAMRPSEPIYSVRLSNNVHTKVFHLWSFVHYGDRFRYVGKMKAIGRPELLRGQDLLEFRPTDAEQRRLAPPQP